MSIGVSWDSEDRTIARFDFPQDWSRALLSEAAQSFALLARGASRGVNLILDLTSTEKMPEGAAFHLRTALANTSVQLDYIVVATTSPSVQNAFAMLADLDHTFGERIIPVRTVDAARAVLSHPYSLRTPVSPAHIERG